MELKDFGKLQARIVKIEQQSQKLQERKEKLALQRTILQEKIETINIKYPPKFEEYDIVLFKGRPFRVYHAYRLDAAPWPWMYTIYAWHENGDSIGYTASEDSLTLVKREVFIDPKED